MGLLVIVRMGTIMISPLVPIELYVYLYNLLIVYYGRQLIPIEMHSPQHRAMHSVLPQVFRFPVPEMRRLPHVITKAMRYRSNP